MKTPKLTLTQWFKVAASVVLLAHSVLSHSISYAMLPLILTIVLWGGELRRWHAARIAAPIAIVALLIAIVASTPRVGHDANRRVNLLVSDGDTVAEPDIANWLLDVLVPESELLLHDSKPTRRAPARWPSAYTVQRLTDDIPISVRQPLQPSHDMFYHVVLIPQGEHGSIAERQNELHWLDDCLVVTLGLRDTVKEYTGAYLGIFTLQVLPTLRRLGYRIDRRYVSVVDDSPSGSLARVASSAPGDVFRNIVRLGSPTSTELPRSSARQVLVGNNPTYDAAYAAWRDAGLNVDHFRTTQPGEQYGIASDVLNGILAVPQSRIELAHREAEQRGFDSRFVMFTDYSIPSGKNRFFVYDYTLRRIVVRSKCAHGCGPGNTEAIPVFSNEMGSECSSLGSFAVHDVHAMAKNGRTAIYLDGLDPTNSNATARGIKMHSGMAMEGEIYPSYLKLGKLSEGCVALSNIPFAMVCGIVDECTRPVLLQCYQ